METENEVIVRNKNLRDTNEVIDAISLEKYGFKYFKKFVFIAYKNEGFVSELKNIQPNLTVKEYKIILESGIKTINDYSKFIEETKNIHINPYTKIRYLFYLHDKEKYSKIIFKPYKKLF
ncbi:MAG: hypothetical protein IPK03_03325 [Bacteroidetes bacterium]|nr:hypothetical protein [Bacteroidota bacterium]